MGHNPYHPFASLSEVLAELSTLYRRLEGREANAVQAAYRLIGPKRAAPTRDLEGRELSPEHQARFDRLAGAVQPPAPEPRRPLPHPGSPEASAMLDSMLAEYDWPANPKNAARAGWEAAQRYLRATPPAREQR